MKEYKIFDLRVDAYEMDELIDYLSNDMERQRVIYSVNPEISYNSITNKELGDIINKGDINIADGMGIVKGVKYIYDKEIERVTGIDLMTNILKSDLKEYRTYLYGAKREVAAQAMDKLNEEHGCNIVGACDGYIKDLDSVVDLINASKAEIVFVGLGSPMQEKFVDMYRDKLLYAKIIMVVGGSFDVLSGNIKRAPKLFIKFNLEWLYRLLREPRRIVRQFTLVKYLYALYHFKRSSK